MRYTSSNNISMIRNKFYNWEVAEVDDEEEYMIALRRTVGLDHLPLFLTAHYSKGTLKIGTEVVIKSSFLVADSLIKNMLESGHYKLYPLYLDDPNP